MADWRSKEAKYYMKVVNRQSIVIVKGEGTRVWDDEGKDYLDFTACLLYTSPSPRDGLLSRMPSSA